MNNVANITVDSDGTTPRKKHNRREENNQKYHDIPLEKNEANKSIIAKRRIVPNASKKIEQIANNKIEQIARKKLT